MRVELVRAGAVISLPADLWRDILALAGRPALGAAARIPAEAAHGLAEALVGAINAGTLPAPLEAELGRLVALVNYLRNGEFEIR
jgi:hypothetical protein